MASSRVYQRFEELGKRINFFMVWDILKPSLKLLSTFTHFTQWFAYSTLWFVLLRFATLQTSRSDIFSSKNQYRNTIKIGKVQFYWWTFKDIKWSTNICWWWIHLTILFYCSVYCILVVPIVSWSASFNSFTYRMVFHHLHLFLRRILPSTFWLLHQ